MQRKEIRRMINENISTLFQKYNVFDIAYERVVESLEPLVIRLIDINVRELKTSLENQKDISSLNAIFENLKNEYRGNKTNEK